MLEEEGAAGGKKSQALLSWLKNSDRISSKEVFGSKFSFVIACAIFANAIFMGFETDMGKQYKSTFFTGECVFAAVFGVREHVLYGRVCLCGGLWGKEADIVGGRDV